MEAEENRTWGPSATHFVGIRSPPSSVFTDLHSRLSFRMSGDFTRSLEERIRAGAAPVVVGLDPRPEAFPGGVARDRPAPERILAYYREVLPVLARHAPVVKPNIAFFERFGAQGYAAYCETCAMARRAGLLVIGDIKRGDIGSTAEAYAEEHFRHADAVTLNPYLGGDSLRPFLSRCRDGRGIFILVRTSNPSARDIQDLPTGDGTLCEAVARLVSRWGAELAPKNGYGPVGAVIGATYGSRMGRMRELMPASWFLIPGVGAQGAAVADTATAFDGEGLGGLVNQSRGILECFSTDDADWLDRVATAAVAFAKEVRRVSRPGDRPV